MFSRIGRDRPPAGGPITAGPTRHVSFIRARFLAVTSIAEKVPLRALSVRGTVALRRILSARGKARPAFATLALIRSIVIGWSPGADPNLCVNS